MKATRQIAYCPNHQRTASGQEISDCHNKSIPNIGFLNAVRIIQWQGHAERKTASQAECGDGNPQKWRKIGQHARVAMEAGIHSIWISAQLEELGHEVIVANVRELRAISHSDRKSDDVDAEKLARYARLDPTSSGRSLIAPSSSNKPSP